MGLNKEAPRDEKTVLSIDKTGEKSKITFSDIKFKNINLWGIGQNTNNGDEKGYVTLGSEGGPFN